MSILSKMKCVQDHKCDEKLVHMFKQQILKTFTSKQTSWVPPWCRYKRKHFKTTLALVILMTGDSATRLFQLTEDVCEKLNVYWTSDARTSRNFRNSVLLSVQKEATRSDPDMWERSFQKFTVSIKTGPTKARSDASCVHERLQGTEEQKDSTSLLWGRVECLNAMETAINHVEGGESAVLSRKLPAASLPPCRRPNLRFNAQFVLGEEFDRET